MDQRPEPLSAPTYAPTSLLTSLPPRLRSGLTAEDADRIATAISAARAESTPTVYAHAWRVWERWCLARGMAPLRGDHAALCAYLAERAEGSIAMSTFDMACTAIRHVHRTNSLKDPVAPETVRQVRLGLRRTYGSAPRRLARPLTVTEIRQIVAGIDRSTPIGVRDAAMILLGFASALRRSELVGPRTLARTMLQRPITPFRTASGGVQVQRVAEGACL